MEKDFFHIYQLWKMFRRIRNQSAVQAQKGDECPLNAKLYKLRDPWELSFPWSQTRDVIC